MPKFYEDIEEAKKKTKYACQNIRDDYLECLLKSDCCKKLDMRTRFRGRKYD